MTNFVFAKRLMYIMLFMSLCMLSLLFGIYLGENSDITRIDHDVTTEEFKIINTLYVIPHSDKVENHNFKCVGHEQEEDISERRVSI